MQIDRSCLPPWSVLPVARSSAVRGRTASYASVRAAPGTCTPTIARRRVSGIVAITTIHIGALRSIEVTFRATSTCQLVDHGRKLLL